MLPFLSRALLLSLLLANAYFVRGQATVGTGSGSGTFTIGVNAGNFGPPLYLAASYSTANMAGSLTPLFVSRAPTGTVNTVFPTTVNWASGDQFGGGNCVVGQKILIIAILFPIATCDSATQLHITGSINNASASSYTLPQGCIGDCQNAVKEDLNIPGHTAGTEKITKLTAGNTIPGGASACATISNGDNDRQFSYPLGTYYWDSLCGGVIMPLQLTKTGNAVQVVNAGCIPFTLNPHGAFTSSWTTETRAYFFDTAASISQTDLSGSGCALSHAETPLVNLLGANVCPGVPNTILGPGGVSSGNTWHSIFGEDTSDDTFAIAIGPHNQGSADWVIVWSKTKGCSTVNFATGQAWAWCTASCTPSTPALAGTLSATGCWGSNGSGGQGMHNAQLMGDGKRVVVSITAPWSSGACAGRTSPVGQATIWEIGTLNDQYAYNGASIGTGGAQYDNHQSDGISRSLSGVGTGPNIRTTANMGSYTVFMNGLGCQDSHGSWPHNNNGILDDTLSWIEACDLVNTTQSTGCANGAAYCPIAYSNEITAWPISASCTPPACTNNIARFTHTFSCGDATPPHAHCTAGGDFYFAPQESIGLVSPRGDIFVWASTHLGSQGNDSGGHPRSDLYAVNLQ